MSRFTESPFDQGQLEKLSSFRERLASKEAEGRSNERNKQLELMEKQVAEAASEIAEGDAAIGAFLERYQEADAAWVIVGMREDLETVRRLFQIEKEKERFQDQLEKAGRLENLVKNYAVIAQNNLAIAQTFAQALKAETNPADIFLGNDATEIDQLVYEMVNQLDPKYQVVQGILESHQFANNCMLNAVFQPIQGELVGQAQQDLLAATTVIRDYEKHKAIEVKTNENFCRATLRFDPKKYHGCYKANLVIRKRDYQKQEEIHKAGIRFRVEGKRKGQEIGIRWDLDKEFTLDVDSRALELVIGQMQIKDRAGHHIRKFDESLTPNDFANVAESYRNLRREFVVE